MPPTAVSRVRRAIGAHSPPSGSAPSTRTRRPTCADSTRSTSASVVVSGCIGLPRRWAAAGAADELGGEGFASRRGELAAHGCCQERYRGGAELGQVELVAA